MFRGLRFLTGTVLLCTVWLASVAGGAVVYSLDGTRTSDANLGGGDRYLTGASMTQATGILTGRGFSVSTRALFTAANIAGANVLFTGLVDVAFSAQELTDIKNFVSAGGGLVVLRDWDGFYPAADPLAAAFGVTYGTSGVGTSSPTLVNKTVNHPIWSGPAGSVSSFSVVFAADVASGATSIGAHAPNPTKSGLAVTTFGNGHVVWLVDEASWSNQEGLMSSPSSNDAIVWANTFEWAAVPVPEPAALGMVATSLSILAARRRRRRARA
jgi:hypothetical protein